jgi:tetratricopeptide (TPR) repeat protein
VTLCAAATVHLDIGIPEFHAGRYAAALEAFERAVALEPDGARFRYWHGAVLRRLERGPEALESLDRALALSDSAAAYWYERGVVKACFMKDLRGAERDFTEASLRGPEHATTWFELGGARYRLRDCGFVEALSRYRNLCATAPCPADRLAWAGQQLAPERAGKLCPESQ